MTTIEVGGLSETLPPRYNKYSDAFKKAESAMKLLLDLSANPNFETMEGWKNSYEKNGEKVYSKEFEIGKIFTLKMILNGTVQKLFHDLWDNITTTPSWNPNFSYVERIEKLTPYCDILKYATADIMFMKGREFLACRLYRKIGSTIYVAARSFEIDEIPKVKNKIRAEMLLGAGRLSPLLSDQQKTLISYVICVNLKINLPQRLIDTCIAYMLHRDSIYARKNAQKLQESNRSQRSMKPSDTLEE